MLDAIDGAADSVGLDEGGRWYRLKLASDYGRQT
jgi:hypothetical protein